MMVLLQLMCTYERECLPPSRYDSLKIELPQETTTEQLLAEIEKLNANPDVHGILLQHPVPEQIDDAHVLMRSL